MKKWTVRGIAFLSILLVLLSFTGVFKSSHESEATFYYNEWSLRSSGVKYGYTDSPLDLMFSERNLRRAISDYDLTELYQMNESDLKIMIRRQSSINILSKDQRFRLTVKMDNQEQAHQLTYALFESLYVQYEIDRRVIRDDAVALLGRKIKSIRIQIIDVEKKLQAMGRKVDESGSYLGKVKYYSDNESFNLLRLKRRELIEQLNELQMLEFRLSLVECLATDPVQLIAWDVPAAVVEFMTERKQRREQR